MTQILSKIGIIKPSLWSSNIEHRHFGQAHKNYRLIFNGFIRTSIATCTHRYHIAWSFWTNHLNRAINFECVKYVFN